MAETGREPAARPRASPGRSRPWRRTPRGRRARSDGPALDPARADLVRWSAAHGLPAPVDGVTTAVRDAPAVSRAAGRGRDWGFGGKPCIHPAQLEQVHAAYAHELLLAGRLDLAAVFREDDAPRPRWPGIRPA